MTYGEAPWVFKGRALYQLQLVRADEARKYIPSNFQLVEAFGYTLGGLYLARYSDSPVGAFEELVTMAGLVWNPPTSCAWAARVYVNNKEARDHGLQHVGLPSRIATFREVPAASHSTHQSSSSTGPQQQGQQQGSSPQPSWWHQQDTSTDSNPGWASGHSSEAMAVQVCNTERHRLRRLPVPVCSLLLPAAKPEGAFAGPRINMALPSYSGATPECPDLLQYACNLWTNVRFVSPAQVIVPASGEESSNSNLELMSGVLRGKPLLTMAFDDMEMTVQEPNRLPVPGVLKGVVREGMT